VSAPIQNACKKHREKGKAEDEQLEQSQSETERYLLQIDKQSKRSFKTPEAAWTAALDINPVFPLCRFPLRHRYRVAMPV
jgi:hypothetical protein